MAKRTQGRSRASQASGSASSTNTSTAQTTPSAEPSPPALADSPPPSMHDRVSMLTRRLHDVLAEVSEACGELASSAEHARTRAQTLEQHQPASDGLADDLGSVAAEIREIDHEIGQAVVAVQQLTVAAPRLVRHAAAAVRDARQRSLSSFDAINGLATTVRGEAEMLRLEREANAASRRAADPEADQTPQQTPADDGGL